MYNKYSSLEELELQIDYVYNLEKELLQFCKEYNIITPSVSRCEDGIGYLFFIDIDEKRYKYIQFELNFHFNKDKEFYFSDQNCPYTDDPEYDRSKGYCYTEVDGKIEKSSFGDKDLIKLEPLDILKKYFRKDIKYAK